MAVRAVETPPPRKPPHNLEVEQALLGALLLHNEVSEVVADFLEPGHFFDPLHGQIYEIALKLIGGNRRATPITMRTFFETAQPISPNLTVPQYLGTLAGRATTIINATDYAHLICDLAMRRALIVVGEDMVNSAYDPAVVLDGEEQLTEAEKRLGALGENGPRGDQEITFEAALVLAVNRADAAFKHDGPVGLPTGLTDLDAKLGGLSDTDLIIVAGRPGMGKTAWATTVAANVALEAAPVHFFSQEMSAEQLATRVLAHRSGLSADKVRRGLINQDDFANMMATQQRISRAKMVIDQTGGLTLAQLETRARRVKRKLGTKLIIIDYLQLMQGVGKENRVQDITVITNGLKALAKELSVPIVALSQLNRGVENRDDKRPHLADLRESGSIEQDADVVVFLFREEYYLNQSEKTPGDEGFGEWMDARAKAANKAEAMIAKHRHGPTGVVHLRFNNELVAFENIARSEAAEMMRGQRHEGA